MHSFAPFGGTYHLLEDYARCLDTAGPGVERRYYKDVHEPDLTAR